MKSEQGLQQAVPPANVTAGTSNISTGENAPSDVGVAGAPAGPGAACFEGPPHFVPMPAFVTPNCEAP